MKIEEIIN